MANFVGINYQASAAQIQAKKQFMSSLNPSQLQKKQASGAAWKNFESELTPEQHAAQQKWLEEKLSGAPKSEWQKDRQAFLAMLNPQEKSDRQNAVNLRRTMLQSLSPQQMGLERNFENLRNTNFINSVEGQSNQSSPSTSQANPSSGGQLNYSA